jgi:hypothetical protein
MTTIHARVLGDQVILPRVEWDSLVEVAQRCADVDIKLAEDDLPVEGLMRVSVEGKAFDWLNDEEELYSLDDLKVRYR